MSKIAIVTDSSVCLPDELIKRYGIHIVPTLVRKGQDFFKDGVEVTCQQVYRWLREGDRLYTSQPSVGDFLNFFSELSKKAESIISIVLTGELSGTYNSAVGAAKMLADIPIQVLDSRTISMAHGFIVLAAARAIEAGNSLAEAVERAKAMIPKVNLLAALETLEYAHRSGRVPGIAALAGSLLKICPILEVKDNQIKVFATVRTKRRAVERLLEEAKRRVGESPAHVAIVHGDVREEAEGLKERLAQHFNLVELYIAEIPAVLGVHTGPGALGLAFYKEE